MHQDITQYPTKTPQERIEAVIASFTSEELEAIDRELSDQNRVRREVHWRQDRDPLGLGWDWLEAQDAD